MKYSIISVVNSAYTKFAYVFLQSAIENLNLDNIYEICLLDTGLLDYDHKKLSSIHPKVKIIKSISEIQSNKSWDTGWQENVLLKTWFANEYLSTYKIPTCLIDIDCMFIKDFHDIVFNATSDIVLCDRSEHRASLPLIASFVGFVNIEASIKFLIHWRTRLSTITGYQTKETPALNEVVYVQTMYNYVKLPYRSIGLYHETGLTDETCIIHFKGGDTDHMDVEEAIIARFDRFPKYKSTITKYIQNV